MPNDCWNDLTITTHSELDLNDIVTHELMNKYPIEHIHKKGKQGIKLTVITPWRPDVGWLTAIRNKYPFVWIKNSWSTEDGFAGVWISRHNQPIQVLEWDDMSLEDLHYFFE